MARWDYKLDGSTYADATDEVVVDLLRQGRLRAHDVVCRTGTEQWTPIERTSLWDEHRRRKTLADKRRVDLPEIRKGRGIEFYVLWFFVTLVTSGFAWNAAETYNPEGNGMFNFVEASLLNNAWLKVIAALLSATFSSLFFATIIIGARLRYATHLSREAHILLIEELRLTREAIAGVPSQISVPPEVVT